MVAAVVVLLLLGSVLAMAEAAMSRMNRVRALALQESGRRNAALLVKIQEDPARYLNSIYLAVMFAQNGSAILVAILAERRWGSLGVTLASVGFTIFYFVGVEAMSKTFGILRSDTVALRLAPIVSVMARILSLPTRALIGLANVLLPGKGLREGPFVSEEEIRSMAEVGHEEGVIEAGEREMIHSIFELGDTTVREIMVPRPDMVVVEAHRPLRAAMDLAIKHGFSRIPVYEKDPDNIVGVVYAKDMLRALRAGNGKEKTVAEVMREPYFVPEAMRVSDLLREMQTKRIHMAIVVDEYGDVAGLVTLEDAIEEIVGEITDEYDVEEPRITPLGSRKGWRVQAKMPVYELNELIVADLPEDEEWQTVGGLVAAALGKVPEAGDEAVYHGFRFRVEKVARRRIGTVIVERLGGESDDDSS
jgi:CBS domain containing-hemolysin-like protein